MEKVQGGEQAPRNSSLALPKDVAVKPFSPKDLLNTILIILISIPANGSDGLPGGHANLSRSLLSLKKNLLEGVLVIEVFAASFGPEEIEQKAPEDVERLALVGEAARVVAVEVRRIVLFFEDSFAKKDKRLGDVEAVGSLPFVLNAEEGVPGLPSWDAFHEAVLGRLRESLVAAFAGGQDSHDLEPGAHRQPVIEDQPGECAHLLWAGIVPHSGNDLGDRRVSEIQLLDKGDDVGGCVASS
jgi:hypothetical protein